MSRTLALQRAADLIRTRYEPPGNYHAKGFYISISSLTKKSAREYAQKLLDWKNGDEHPDTVPKYYAFIGNTLGDEAFADYPHKEIQAVIALDDKWFMVGHCDALKVVDIATITEPGYDPLVVSVATHNNARYVIVGEHKFHGENTDENTEAAKRQGHLYLAMFYEMFLSAQPDRNNPTVPVAFNIAPYTYVMPDGSRGFDPDTMLPLPGAIPAKGNTPFVWEPDMVPGGVVVGIAEAKPPGNVFMHEVDEKVCQEYLAFYTAKARVIIECFKKDDLAPAEEWDFENGILEFARSFESIHHEKGDLAVLAPKLYELRKQKDDVEAEISKLSAEVLAKMQEVGRRKDVVGEYVLTHVVQSNGERVDAKAFKAYVAQSGNELLKQFIKDGGNKQFVRVSRKGGGEA